MNAVKKSNDISEQQLVAELELRAQQQLAASLANFGKQLMDQQQQLLQDYSAQIQAKSQSQWQPPLIEQEQAQQKRFVDGQHPKQQLGLAVPTASADNQELTGLKQKISETSRQMLAAELKKAQLHNIALNERKVRFEQQLAELKKELADNSAELGSELARLQAEFVNSTEQLSQSQNRSEKLETQLEHAINRQQAAEQKQQYEADQSREMIRQLRKQLAEQDDVNQLHVSELEQKIMEYKLKFEYAQKQLAVSG